MRTKPKAVESLSNRLTLENNGRDILIMLDSKWPICNIGILIVRYHLPTKCIGTLRLNRAHRIREIS